MSVSAATRFLSKVEEGSPNECWPWMGGRFKDGNGVASYGAFTIGRRTIKAHRYAYAIAFGPFDTRLKVCHQCDNPMCCNPNHLWLGTYDDNNKDRNLKGRQAKGESVSTARLTEQQVIAIRDDPRTQRAIAAAYGLAKSTVGYIKSKRNWSYL